MDDAEAKQLADLALTCAMACITGQDYVTLTVRGMRPQGFPRGELLSQGTDGSRNYAVDPIKALTWLRTRTRASKTHNARLSGPQQREEDHE